MRRLYLHLPRLPVQCAVRDSAELRHVPLALSEEAHGQQRVAFVSSAALKAGVQPGMGVTAARAQLPSLQVRRFDAEDTARELHALGEALLALGPVFEPVFPDGLFLDASAAPLCRGEGTPEDNLGERVLALCAEWGLLGRVALSSSAFTARALARHQPARLQRVEPGADAAALFPLPLEGLGEVAPRAVAALRALGLTTLGEVAALPSASVVTRLGAEGRKVQGLCRGVDPTPLRPAALPETVEERVELESPAEQLEPVLFALKTALDRCAARLQGRGLAAVRLELLLRLGHGADHPVPLQLSRPSSQARLWLELFRHLLAVVQLPHAVVGLQVRVAETQTATQLQGELGDGPQGDAPLESVLSRLATALGEEALVAATLEPSHRPEAATRPARFQPPLAPRGLLSELLPSAGPQALGVAAEPAAFISPEADGPLPPGWGGLEEGLGESLPSPGWLAGLPVVEEPSPEQRALSAQGERPARLLPTPLALDLVLGASGLPALLRVAGRMRRVLALFGPERLSGEWWELQPLERDYYRGQLEGLGLVWLYRDGRDGRFYLHGLFD